MELEEEWRDVVGYEGLYQVSSLGEVRSLYFQPPRLVKPVLATCKGASRLQVNLYKNRKSSTIKVHRIVLESFVGPRPAGMECCHEDGDPTNNRLSNLRWDTHAANEADKKLHGTQNKGEANGGSKLTARQVLQIKELLSQGATNSQLALLFNVSSTAISKIKTGRKWTWLS